MPRLPNLIRVPLQRGADVASVASLALDRTAGLLRRAAGDDRRGGSVSQPARLQPVPAPREPATRPATSASPATRGSRQISNPKAARKTRARAASLGSEQTPS